MAEQQQASPEQQSEQVVRILGDIAERSRSIVEDFIARQAETGSMPTVFDPRALGNTFVDYLNRIISSPTEIIQAQFDLWQDYVRLWQTTTQKMLGQDVEPVIAPDRADRRFDQVLRMIEIAQRQFNFIKFAPVLFVSAATGFRVNEILPAAVRVNDSRQMRVQTSDLNRIIREANIKHAPPVRNGRALKVFFGAQVSINPSTPASSAFSAWRIVVTSCTTRPPQPWTCSTRRPGSPRLDSTSGTRARSSRASLASPSGSLAIRLGRLTIGGAPCTSARAAR